MAIRSFAPADGSVGERQVRPGQLVSPGTQVIPFVDRTRWVQANYKETQLTNVRVGDAAEIRIDEFPGQVIHGKVIEISPASGSQFALLPPDNSTGNYTKVVQRIPVKIALDDASLAAKLRPGYLRSHGPRETIAGDHGCYCDHNPSANPGGDCACYRYGNPLGILPPGSGGNSRVLIGAGLVTLTSRMLSLGLADLRGHVGLGFDEGAWCSDAFDGGLMFIGPFIVYVGGLLGPRRVLLFAAAAFTVTCAFLPLIHSYSLLIAALIVPAWHQAPFIRSP